MSNRLDTGLSSIYKNLNIPMETHKTENLD